MHIAGCSAGAGLAAVVAAEATARRGVAVRSLLADEPMLDPRCSSPSYLHNGATTIAVVEWLRWSWSVYAPAAAAAVPAGGLAELLAQSEARHQAELLGLLSPYDATGALLTGRDNTNNNCTTNNSPINNNNSTNNTPSNSNLTKFTKSASHPLTLVVTATADPLRDEGRAYADAVRVAGCLVKHVEARGSHVLALALDKGARREMLAAWCAMLAR